MMRRVKTLRFLRNEVVLITGGSSGIGKALALEAARRGAIVVVTARNEEKLEQVAKQCLLLSGRPAFAYRMDATSPDDIDEVLDKIQHQVGGIDVLVNSAGLGEFTPAASQSYKTMRQMTDVNLLALMYISRCVARQMMAQGYGALLTWGQQTVRFRPRIARLIQPARRGSFSLITSCGWKWQTTVSRC